MDKKKKAAIQKQEDQALTRALVWFAGAMVVEFLLLLVNNVFTRGVPSWSFANALCNFLPILAVVFLAGAVGAGVWCWKGTKAKQELAFMPMVLAVVLLTLCGCALVLGISISAMELLCVLVPAGAVLALVYYLYQKEFFTSVCAVAVSMLGLWLVRKNTGLHDVIVTAYVVLAALALIALLVLVLKAGKNGGVLKLGAVRLVFNPKNGGLTPAVISGLAGLVAVVAGLILGSVAAFYLLFALLGWLLVLLVYYTVKLM